MEHHVYDEFHNLEKSHWWFRGRRAYLDKIINKFVDCSNSIDTKFCEVGSGTGGNLTLLTKFSSTVDCIEMNDHARSIIVNKNIKGVDNIYSGHLPDNIELLEKYDAVFCLDVIEHIDDDFKSVKRLKDLIKNNGVLIATVPAYQWLWSAHDVANHHKRRYTKTTFLELFQNNDFEVIYCSYFNSILLPLAIIDRIINKFKNSTDKATLNQPIKLINHFFYKIFQIETLWAGKLSALFGLSLVIVVRQKH